MHKVMRPLAFLWLLAAIPASAAAQAVIAGSVKDPSGAVLPGVSVEAASPALIEKVRVGGHRRHRTVSGSRTCGPGPTRSRSRCRDSTRFKREGIELTGSFTATINAELKVGALAETITVTGETPDRRRAEREAAR